ncbi:MAG TPA: hypothetical protein VLY45_03045 [Nitrospiria bacterium]|nr:hypothetical protein [Nitrospiria bacterium]
MKKLLVAAVGLVTVLAAFPVYAVDVNFSGEFRVRAFWDDNLFDGNSSTDDSSRFADLRFRLKTAIKAGVTTGVVVLDFTNCSPGSDVSSFQNGTTPAIPFPPIPFPPGTAQTGNCRFGSAGFGNSYNVVGIREAYLHIDLTRLGLYLGRQTIKVGHGIVLDSTADAITVVLPMGSTTVTASMLQVADLNDAAPTGSVFPNGVGINQDTTVWLVNVGMDRGSHLINLYDAFLYDQSPGTNNGATMYPTMPLALGAPLTAYFPGVNKLWVNYLGVSLDAKSGPLALALEGSYDFGDAEQGPGATDVRLNGWNLMGDVTTDAGGAKLGGTVVYAAGKSPSATGSGTVSDISGNFQLGNILLNNEQYSDRDGGSLGGGLNGAGIFAVKLHADMMPTEKLDLSGAVIYAQTAAVPCAGCNNRQIGYELDANAKYNVDDNMAFYAGAGYLITGSGAADFYNNFNATTGSNSNIWKLSAKAVFTF